MEARFPFDLKSRHVLLGALVLLGLYLSSRYSYLLFHSFAEVFSVSVAGTVFMVSWSTRRSPDSGYFSFLGIGYLFVAGVDFLHLLAYKGMGVFPGYDANLPTQLWIATRYLLAVNFLTAPVFSGRALNHRLVFAVYTAVTALLLASIFAWKVFPDCFIEGDGLTPFKIISEYVVSGIFLASIAFLARKKEHFDREVLRILVSSVVAAVGSEMAFTLYTDVYGLSNLLGHFLQILSFYLVYRAIVGTDLVRKHELSRRLQEELDERSRAERSLLDTQRELRNRQAELTALLEGSRSVLTRREFQDAARSIFLSCKNLFGAGAGYVALLSSDGAENEIAFLDPGGLPCTVDPSLPMPIRGLRAEAYRTGEAVFDNDFSRSEWTRYLPEGHASLENVLFAPLLVEGKAVGLIGLANKPGGFTGDDARIASAFGELAAVALLNSRMLESLEASEERFRSVAQTANDAIISIDGGGTIVLWNQGAEKMFGYAAEEMVGRPLSGIIPPRYRDAHENGMARAFLSGTSRLAGKTIEMAGFRKDGGEFPLELSMANWKAGEKIFFTGILRDITERKIVEERTRHLASFPQYNPNPIVEVDGSGNIVFWNPAAERMLETLGMDKGDVGVFLPSDLDAILGELEKKNEATFDREITVKDRVFGQTVHLAPQFQVVRIYARDITERKRAEAELRAAKERLEERVAERTEKLSIFADLLQKELAQRRKAEEELALNEERFRSLVTGSLVGILILRDGRIAYMNPEQKRLFGELPENFPLRELPDVHPEDRAEFEMFCDSVLSEKSGSLDIDLRFYPSGGSPAGVDLRWVHCRATAIRSGAEKAYLVNMVDITRLKEMEHQVRTREKLASLGHVAAGIAHEIRSPLSGINIYLAALQQVHVAAESMEPEARDQAAEIALQIQSAAHRIESVIKKVMDFTRPAAPRKELVDVGMAVENAIDFTAANLVKSGIILDRSRFVSLPKCSADLHMITQVVMNLISNAAHAMEEHRDLKTIEISSTVEEGRIVLLVSDSGPGVPLAIRDKIFDPFYTTRKDGYGIGLSFCRRVIEDHAGTLEVGGSRLGGAEFRIGIPLPGKGIPT